MRWPAGTAGLAALLAAVALLSACAPGAPEAPGPPAAPPPAQAMPPMRITGQKVLVLPVQQMAGLPQEVRARVDAELLFALGERGTGVQWIAPEALERALRRSPGFAPDPRGLPSDPLVHHRERRAVEPLAGVLRRYSALTDARLVLLPRALAWVQAPGAPDGELRVSAAMIDARSGDVVWWGEAAGERRPEPDSAALATALESLARRMLAGDAP